MNVRVHPMTDASLAECTDVYMAAFAAPPWNESWPRESVWVRLQELTEQPRSRGLVAIAEDGVVLGFILANAIQGADRTIVRIAELCVRPDAQRHGIGARLVRELERFAKEEGAGSLALTTGPEFVPFYERLGYRQRDDWIAMTHELESDE